MAHGHAMTIVDIQDGAHGSMDKRGSLAGNFLMDRPDCGGTPPPHALRESQGNFSGSCLGASQDGSYEIQETVLGRSNDLLIQVAPL